MNNVHFERGYIMNVAATSKEAILEICLRLVKEKGLGSINMRFVASECKVSVGSIYNYFPSKSDLICATVEWVWRDIFHSAGKKCEFVSFVECLDWLFESIQNGRDAYPEFFSFHAISFATEDKVAGKKMMEGYFTKLKNILLGSLEEDENIRGDAFSEVLTKDIFVDYVFTNFISSLLSSRGNGEALVEIVRRCLY